MIKESTDLASCARTVREPPCTFLTPIILRSMLSASDRTASTTISEKKILLPLISLEFIAVPAHRISISRCLL